MPNNIKSIQMFFILNQVVNYYFSRFDSKLHSDNKYTQVV